MMIGVWSLAPRRRRQMDRPSSPGIIRSSTSRSNRSRSQSLFMAVAFSATSTVNPCSPR
ncbi:hypothetical protein D3C81_2040310 [compost metagenome]